MGSGEEEENALRAIWRLVGGVWWLCSCEGDAVVTLDLESLQ